MMNLFRSALKAPFAKLGSHQLKPQDEPQVTQGSQFVQDDLIAPLSSTKPCTPRTGTIASPATSHPEKTPRFFPSELPPRPQKHSRLPIRRKRASTSSEAIAPASPISPPLSPTSCSPDFFSAPSDSANLRRQTLLTPLTPPPSPPSADSHGDSSNTALSLTPVSTTLAQCATAPTASLPDWNSHLARRPCAVQLGFTPRSSQPVRKPLSVGASPPSFADNTVQPPREVEQSSSDPLAERFLRLKFGHLPPTPSQPTLSGVSSSQSSTPNDYLAPPEETLSAMGASRTVRRRALRENSHPYTGPTRGKDRAQTKNFDTSWSLHSQPEDVDSGESVSQFDRRNQVPEGFPSTAPQNSSAINRSGAITRKSRDTYHLRRGYFARSHSHQHAPDDVHYPDLAIALSESSSRTRSPTLSPELAPSLDEPNRHATAVQEERDRVLAERLQQEEDEAYDELMTTLSALDGSSSEEHENSIFERLRNITRASPLPTASSSTERVLTPNTSATSQRCGRRGRGTSTDPIEIDSDTDDLDDNFFDLWHQQHHEEAPSGDPMVIDGDSSEEETPSNKVRLTPLEISNPPVVVGKELLRAPADDEIATWWRSEPRHRDCVVCGGATPIADLPALVDCAHQPDTCAECFASWIASELEEKGWRSIKCPGSDCRVILAHHEIQQYANKETFEQYDMLTVRAALGDDENFIWCQAPDCDSGQIHISGEEGNIFTCVACGHRVCVKHNNTWHEGETCEEYDYRVSGRKERDQKAQEEASEETIGKLSKKCPGNACNFNIEKSGGCDHMTCSRCRYEFCWICLADYNQIRSKGNSAHAKSCKYHSDRIK